MPLLLVRRALQVLAAVLAFLADGEVAVGEELIEGYAWRTGLRTGPGRAGLLLLGLLLLLLLFGSGWWCTC
jgi:hypothetical protein